MVKIYFLVALISIACFTMYFGASDISVKQTKITKTVKIPVKVE